MCSVPEEQIPCLLQYRTTSFYRIPYTITLYTRVIIFSMYKSESVHHDEDSLVKEKRGFLSSCASTATASIKGNWRKDGRKEEVPPALVPFASAAIHEIRCQHCMDKRGNENVRGG